MYHSNSVFSALSSSWSSRPPLAIKYRLDTGALVESGGGKSHGSTLERLLAWEKKLYGEVKVIIIPKFHLFLFFFCLIFFFRIREMEMGLLFKCNYWYATNNVACVCSYWHIGIQ